MLFSLLIGCLSAIVLLIVMWRIDIRKFMGYPATLDLVVTISLMWMLHGSYVGMTAAVAGGIFFSGVITLIRNLYGYKTLTVRGWVTHQGKWYQQCIKYMKESGYV